MYAPAFQARTAFGFEVYIYGNILRIHLYNRLLIFSYTSFYLHQILCALGFIHIYTI